MNKRETAEVCGYVGAAYPNWQAKKETMQLWHEFLGDLKHDDVLTAVKSWILNEDYAPTIAGIRRLCAEQSGALPISASEAWGELTSVIREYGLYGEKPSWSNEQLAETVKAIGYWNLCSSTNLDTIRAQFTKAYNERAEVARKEIINRRNFDLELPALSENSTVVESKNNLELGEGQ